MLAHTMNEGSANQESEGTTGLIKDEVDVDEDLSTFVPAQLQGEEEVATAPKQHQEEGTELDPKIWSSLSEHLLENILAWLPLPSLFVLRTVCKQWNAFTYSPSFLAICARVPPPKQAWFLFRGDGKECVAFNPDVRKWHRLPIDQYLPARRVVASAVWFGLWTPTGRSAGGVQPHVQSMDGAPSQAPYPIVGMVMDRESGGYMLVVAGSHNASGKSLTTEVYNSTTKSWKLIGTRPFQYRFQTNAVHFHGSLHRRFPCDLGVQPGAGAVDGGARPSAGRAHTTHGAPDLQVPRLPSPSGGCHRAIPHHSRLPRVLRHPSDPWTNITSMPPPLPKRLSLFQVMFRSTYQGGG